MKRYTWLLLVVLTGGVCHAQFVVDTSLNLAKGGYEAGVAFGLTEVEYDSKDLDDPEVQRTWLGAYGAYGLNDRVDAYAAAGLIVKSEPQKNWDDSGSGFLMIVGARGLVARMEKADINAYGQLTYLTEDYGENNEQGAKTEADASITEVAAGVTAIYAVNPTWSVYGGLEVTPFSDGEVEASNRHGSQDFDIERDSAFALRGGARVQLERFWLRGEVGLLGETTFLFAGGIAL